MVDRRTHSTCGAPGRIDRRRGEWGATANDCYRSCATLQIALAGAWRFQTWIAPMKLKSSGEAKESDVELIAHDGSKIRARIDGVEVEAEWIEQGDGSAILSLDGRKLRIFAARRDDSVLVAAGPASLEFKRVERARS